MAFPQGMAAPGYQMLVDVNGNPLGTSANPLISEDQIRAYILAGQGFSATTGLITTGIAAAFVGIELLCNAAAKNILLYNVLITGNGNGADGRLYQGLTNTLDTGLTTNLATAGIVNQSGAATASVVTSLMGSPAATVQLGGLVGNQRVQIGVPQFYTNNLLQNESVVFIPKSTVGFCAAYMKVVTLGNSAGLTLEWVEF